MKTINEFLNKKDNIDNEKLSEELKDFIIKYTKYYEYDAIKLVCMINLELRDLLMKDSDVLAACNNPDEALEKFKKEFEKYQNIAI